MTAHYEAPGNDLELFMDEAPRKVERATTMTLLLANKQIADDQKRLKKDHKKARKTAVKAEDDASKITKVAVVIFAAGATAALTVGTGGGAGVAAGIAFFLGKKAIGSAKKRVVASSSRDKKRRIFFGPTAEPPEPKIREFVKSAANHFRMAREWHVAVDKLLAAELGTVEASELIKRYAKFRHDLDKAAFYLEALQVLSIDNYMRLGFNAEGKPSANGLLPNGRRQRDKLLLIIRSAHIEFKANRPVLDGELMAAFGVDAAVITAQCPSDPFGPEDDFAEAAELVPILVELHQQLVLPEGLDPRVRADVEGAFANSIRWTEAIDEIVAGFQTAVAEVEKPSFPKQWKHSYKRSWKEATLKQIGAKVIDEVVKPAAKNIPLPGASKVITKASQTLWKIIGKKAKLFGTATFYQLRNSDNTIKSATAVDPNDLTELAVTVQENILDAALQLRLADLALEALHTLTKSTSSGLAASPPDQPVFLEEARSKKSGTREYQPLVGPLAYPKPDQAARSYYKYAYHCKTAVSYIYPIALFECALAKGIIELMEQDERVFSKVMGRLALEIVHEVRGKQNDT